MDGLKSTMCKVFSDLSTILVAHFLFYVHFELYIFNYIEHQYIRYNDTK